MTTEKSFYKLNILLDTNLKCKTNRIPDIIKLITSKNIIIPSYYLHPADVIQRHS